MTKENNIIFDRETAECFEKVRLSENYIEMDVWEAMADINSKNNQESLYKDLIKQKTDYIKNINLCQKQQNPQQKN